VLKFYKNNVEFEEQQSGAETLKIELEKNKVLASVVSHVGVNIPAGI
jgi:hypothetical protein